MSNISKIAFIGSHWVKPLMTIKDFYNNIK